MALKLAGLGWRHDTSNSGERYFRNRIRRNVVPVWVETAGRDAVAGAARSRALLEEDDIALEDHPPNREDVQLRLMPTDGSDPPIVLTRLFGGQGTINVPSWSPDGRQIAFVSYRLKR